MLQKSKWIVFGLVIGLILSIGVQGLAATYQYINAIKNDQVSFLIDGEQKSIPEDFTALFYEDRLYLPIRFIAEELGAEIKWHGDKRQVEIITASKTEPELPPTVETGDNLEEENISVPKDISIYKELPITNYVGKSLVTVEDLTVLDKERTLITIEIHNTGETPVQLIQSESKLIVDEKEYAHSDVSDRVSTKYDFAWYQDIVEDDKRKATITLPGIPVDSKYAELSLKLVDNDGSTKEHDLQFHIKLK